MIQINTYCSENKKFDRIGYDKSVGYPVVKIATWKDVS